jgi:hypothetical protein
MEPDIWTQITTVPERFVEGNKRLCLQFLLKKADKVEECFRPHGKSRYRAYFDDGVFKGQFVFTFRQSDLTPLSVLQQCASTGWPGFRLAWLEDICADKMKTKLEAA